MDSLASRAAHAQHAAAYLDSIAKSARPSVRSNLRRAAAIAAGHPADWDRYPWHRLDAASLAALRNQVAEHYAVATANATLASVRGVLRRAWHAGDLDRADYERRLDALRRVGGESAPGRVLTAAQVGSLFAACPNTVAGRRDAALLAVLYGCGLRRAEAARLDLEDLDRETWTMKVRGKGRRERIAYPKGGAQAAVTAWLGSRGDEPGPMFCPVDRQGRVAAGRGMTTRAIAKRIERLGRAANLGSVSPHMLRRAFATALLDQGNDLAVTADLMGHARTDTTRLYDRRGEAAKQRAAASIAVPYVETAEDDAED